VAAEATPGEPTAAAEPDAAATVVDMPAKPAGPKTAEPTAADVEEKPAAAAVDTPATVTEEEPMEKVEKNVNLDAAATVEELPGVDCALGLLGISHMWGLVS
jgi:hypothetical protein